MKQSTIKDVRTTLIVLLVSILSSASAIYVLPTVIAPVHAGFSNPAVTISPGSPAVPGTFTVTINVPLGQSVTSICVYVYNTQGHQIKTNPTTCFSSASAPAFTVSQTT